MAEAEVEQGERQAQQRGRGAEIAVEFPPEGEGLAVEGGTRHVEPSVHQAGGLVVVEATEGFGDVEPKRAAGNDGGKGERTKGGGA